MSVTVNTLKILQLHNCSCTCQSPVKAQLCITTGRGRGPFCKKAEADHIIRVSITGDVHNFARGVLE